MPAMIRKQFFVLRSMTSPLGFGVERKANLQVAV